MRRAAAVALVAIGLAGMVLALSAPRGLEAPLILASALAALAGVAAASPGPRPRLRVDPDRPRPFRVEIEVPMSTDPWAVDALVENLREDCVLMSAGPHPDDPEIVLVAVKELATSKALADRVARRRLERAGLILERSRAAAL